jgi:hypothetical protein
MAMPVEPVGPSTRDIHTVAEHGGHYLQQENPAVVATYFRNLLSEIRSGNN